MPVIILFMFPLYISRYPSVRNAHFPWICIFFLLFLFKVFPKNPPKVCTRSINFNLKNAKAPSCGRGDTPSLPHPPPARALRALACVFPRILYIILPPPPGNIPAYGLAIFQLCNQNVTFNLNEVFIRILADPYNYTDVLVLELRPQNWPTGIIWVGKLWWWFSASLMSLVHSWHDNQPGLAAY